MMSGLIVLTLPITIIGANFDEAHRAPAPLRPTLPTRTLTLALGQNPKPSPKPQPQPEPEP